MSLIIGTVLVVVFCFDDKCSLVGLGEEVDCLSGGLLEPRRVECVLDDAGSAALWILLRVRRSDMISRAEN